jgi:hypothetical protein
MQQGSKTGLLSALRFMQSLIQVGHRTVKCPDLSTPCPERHSVPTKGEPSASSRGIMQNANSVAPPYNCIIRQSSCSLGKKFGHVRSQKTVGWESNRRQREGRLSWAQGATIICRLRGQPEERSPLARRVICDIDHELRAVCTEEYVMSGIWIHVIRLPGTPTRRVINKPARTIDCMTHL